MKKLQSPKGYRYTEKKVKKRLIFFLFVFICLWRPCIELGCYAVASVYCFVKGYRFQAKAVSLDRDKITFYDFSLGRKEVGDVSGKEIVFWFWRRHVDVERVHICLKKLPASEGKSEWTYKFKEATLEGEGLSFLSFEAERNFPGELGKFQLFWENGAKASCELFQEEERIYGHFECTRFDPIFFRRWLGDQWAGECTGQIYLSKDLRIFGRMEVEKLRWTDLFQEGVGSVEFEAPLDSARWLKEAELRLKVQQGMLRVENAFIDHIAGEAVFAAQIGAQGTFQAEGHFQDQQLPISLEGKILFPKGEKKWAEGKAQLGDARFEWSGLDLWALTCREAGFLEVGLGSAFLTRWFPTVDPFSMQKGLLKFTLKGSETISEVKGEISQFSGTYGDLHLALDLADGQYCFQTGDGAFEVSGVVTSLAPDFLIKAEGGGRIEKGVLAESTLIGKVLDHSLTIHAAGTLSSMQLAIQTEGLFNGFAEVLGGFNGEKWLWSVAQGTLEDVTFSGEGGVDLSLHFYAKFDRIVGSLDTLSRLLGKEMGHVGKLKGLGDGLILWGGPKEWSWAFHGEFFDGGGQFLPHVEVKGVRGEIFCSPTSLKISELKGELVLGKTFPFYCPIFDTQGEFDFRIEAPMWDLVRLKGYIEDTTVLLDTETSHFFSAPFEEGKITVQGTDLTDCKIQVLLDWKEVLAAIDSLNLPKEWLSVPLRGQVEVALSKLSGKKAAISLEGRDLFYEKAPLALRCTLSGEESLWQIDHAEFDGWNILGNFALQKEGIKWLLGQIEHPKKGAFSFEAGWDLQGGLDAHLSRFSLHSSALLPWIVLAKEVEATWNGSGHVSWKDKWEFDFDLDPFCLHLGSWEIESQTQLHMYLAPEKGVLIRGLDLVIGKESFEGKGQAKLDFLEYDRKAKEWVAHEALLYGPQNILNEFFPSSFFSQKIGGVNLHGTFRLASDFSRLQGVMPRASLPLAGYFSEFENCRFSLDAKHFEMSCFYLYQGNPLEVDFLAKGFPQIQGRLCLHEPEYPDELPLSFDWEYEEQKGFTLRSAEGSFGGIDALFHAEEEKGLIGSARIDCERLASFVPENIAKVFRELKMGKGYEIKGHVELKSEGLSFNGLLGGKQCTLFGFQFKTLLGQIAWGSDFFSLTDLKVSDSAGILRVDQVRAHGKPKEAWELSIPLIAVTELRPSLLQRPGEKPGPMTPLVVRELFIRDLKGDPERNETWTAQGDLKFINSFKREYTVFDIPADVLSRIFGLDLELLIPVCGQLKFDLEKGICKLKELKHSYSEGKRSEFFLIEEGGSPTMDLDWNLRILVTMKQFVLFKFTESFVISIDGKLGDPQFHLKKKKGFLQF